MAGSPGLGKTVLARVLPGILPEMSSGVPRVDYEKRSVDRMGESSESIRPQGDQAAEQAVRRTLATDAHRPGVRCQGVSWSVEVDTGVIRGHQKTFSVT